MKPRATMTGVWLEKGTISLKRDLATPRPESGEALVRVSLAGICGTDLALLRGYGDFSGVPGHEFSGRVAECPDRPEWAGERVVGEINLACGECAWCRAGTRNHCRRRGVLGIRGCDGAFAEFLVIPIPNLHRIPDNVSDESAVFTEPLAAAVRICEQLDLADFDSILVVGAGRLGQLIARVLAAAGSSPSVVIRHSRHGELLAGVPAKTLREEEIRDGEFDLVVEASGSPSGLPVALKAVRPQGTIVLKSTYHGRCEFDLSPLMVHEVALIGSRCGPFGPALEYLERGLEVESLLDATLPLEQAERAFEMASRRGALKVLLRPRGTH